MKKFFSILLLSTIVLPCLAITDVTKEQAKYNAKIEKIERKQKLKCLKHPEKCITAPVQETNLTLGTAQKNIKIGTTQEEVALALGSPNIITVDSEGHDTWIYDKMASVSSYNSSGFSVGAGGIGGGAGGHGGGGGILGASYGKGGGNYQTTQKTLTIVIKFTDSKVSSFNYHMSSF